MTTELKITSEEMYLEYKRNERKSILKELPSNIDRFKAKLEDSYPLKQESMAVVMENLQYLVEWKINAAKTIKDEERFKTLNVLIDMAKLKIINEIVNY